MKQNRLALGLSLLGAALIGAGLLLSQQGIVLAKAARICMECVGLG